MKKNNIRSFDKPIGKNPFTVSINLQLEKIEYDLIINTREGTTINKTRKSYTKTIGTTITEITSVEYINTIINLSAIASRVLNIIKFYYLQPDKDYVYFKYNTFCDNFNIGLSTLYKALKELEASGIINKTSSGGVYWINSLFFLKGDIKKFHMNNDTAEITRTIKTRPEYIDFTKIK